MFKNTFFILLSALCLSGCQSTFGPSALNESHPSYNQVIVNSLNQQMLLNLVRLRYRDEANFLTISSVTTSSTFGGNLGVNTSLDLGIAGNIIQPNVGVTYSESPTISYQPLQGEDFLKSVLSPISLDAVLVLTQSGWNVERVFGMCVERVNNLHNAPTASGPTPEFEPEFKDFKQMLKVFRELQLKQGVEIGVDEKEELKFLFKPNPNNRDIAQQLSTLLGIEKFKKQNLVRVGTNFLNPSNNEITLRTRSISSVLFYLSQMVAVPKQHIEDGLVTMTKNNQGELFDWGQTPGGEKFRVRVSASYPDKAFLAVPYRGYWYFIPDNDLQSKSTFMLLRQLFDLQAGQTKYSGPTLTLPVR